jgi:hypothetical protein
MPATYNTLFKYPAWIYHLNQQVQLKERNKTFNFLKYLKQNVKYINTRKKIKQKIINNKKV